MKLEAAEGQIIMKKFVDPEAENKIIMPENA